MKPGCHQACDMGHIHHQIGVYRRRDFRKSIKIYNTRIRACAGNNQLWSVLICQSFQFFIVYGAGIRIYAIMNKII